MTILLYDHLELDERAARHLKVWKAWHVMLYALAAIFGIINFIFLHNTIEFVDNNCIFYPRALEFHLVELPEHNGDTNDVITTNTHLINNTISNNITKAKPEGEISNERNEISKQNVTDNHNTISNNNTSNTRTKSQGEISNERNASKENVTDTHRRKRETDDNESNDDAVFAGNSTHRLVLDTSRSLFPRELDVSCQFAEYMPIISIISAILWITLFTMCPSGGHARSGLRQPWRILAPSLVFAIVLVGLLGHSFRVTNGGLEAFCADFHNYTNTTTCSAVNPYLELSWNTSWSFGSRASSLRAASAGAWASWACIAALLLARCLAAPDFSLRRTGVYLVKDPEKKLAPYLKKSARRTRGAKSVPSTPTKPDTISIQSEPTVTTDLVTATIEPGQESIPPSSTVTPIKYQRKEDIIDVHPQSDEEREL